MKESVSVIICCNTLHAEKNALKDKSNISSTCICFGEIAAQFTQKNEHFSLLYVYNISYANVRFKKDTFEWLGYNWWGGWGFKHAVADKLQIIKRTMKCFMQWIQI